MQKFPDSVKSFPRAKISTDELNQDIKSSGNICLGLDTNNIWILAVTFNKIIIIGQDVEILKPVVGFAINEQVNLTNIRQDFTIIL